VQVADEALAAFTGSAENIEAARRFLAARDRLAPIQVAQLEAILYDAGANPQTVPDLVLMDVRMPRMTGYEACKIMKATPDLRDIPVVFLSAKGQESEIQQGLEAGAEEYLLEPFAPDQLTNRVKVILGKFGK
jgi:CheY-like chemotaxis protein